MSSGEAFGRRFAATFIDGVIILVPSFVLSALLFPLIASGEGDAAMGLFYLIVLPLAFAYSVGMLVWRGQTLGKMALGIRVIGPNGGNPSFWRAAVRETIGKWLSQFILYLGYLWMLWDAEQQCWHDKIAGTHVERA